MNRKQLVALWIGIALFVLAGLFPPWLTYVNISHASYTEMSERKARIQIMAENYAKDKKLPPGPPFEEEKLERELQASSERYVLAAVPVFPPRWDVFILTPIFATPFYSPYRPPRFEGDKGFPGYDQPPLGVVLDVTRLLIQWAMIAVLTAGAILTLADRKPRHRE